MQKLEPWGDAWGEAVGTILVAPVVGRSEEGVGKAWGERTDGELEGILEIELVPPLISKYNSEANQI